LKLFVAFSTLSIYNEVPQKKEVTKMCEIANKIKTRRQELGLTLEDVAQAVGVGRSTVRKWETGMIKNMGRDKIAALADVLQINPVELVPMPSRAMRSDDEERLEALHQDPRLCLLFDRSRKMSRSDVEFMLQMADRILKERDPDA
jgi:transcriptional regulator with XRE-family HTH domain